MNPHHIAQALRDYSPAKPWDSRLSVLYDQNGSWCHDIASLPLHSRPIAWETLQKLQDKKLTEEEIAEGPHRECLFTSYHMNPKKDEPLPYQKIQGFLFAPKCQRVQAPHLQTVDQLLWAPDATETHFPKLQTADFEKLNTVLGEVNLPPLKLDKKALANLPSHGTEKDRTRMWEEKLWKKIKSQRELQQKNCA